MNPTNEGNNANDIRTVRTFASGATRDADTDKIDFEGFLSPLVLQRFGEYMHHHRKQADGQLRSSDNWQKGMSREVYMKSLIRHLHDLWLEHDGFTSREGIEDALCGILFNTQGYLFEVLREKGYGKSKYHIVPTPKDAA